MILAVEKVNVLSEYLMGSAPNTNRSLAMVSSFHSYFLCSACFCTAAAVALVYSRTPNRLSPVPFFYMQLLKLCLFSYRLPVLVA